MTLNSRIQLALLALAACVAVSVVAYYFATTKGRGNNNNHVLDAQWLHRIHGPDRVTSWTLWLYDDPVTGRRVLLPSQPHALQAEPLMVQLFNQLRCSTDGTSNYLFVDVGMNSGFYTLLARLRGCRVLSFEVQPSCIEMYRLAERANAVAEPEHMLRIVNQPVADTNGQRIELSTDKVFRCEGMFSLFWKGASRFESVTLDTVLWPLPQHVPMLKLDIEGFEPKAVAGAMRMLGARRIDAILMEATWWPNVFQPLRNAYELIAPVFAHGYSIRCIGPPSVWDAEFQDAASWIAYGASAAASRPLSDQESGCYVSTCSEYLICLAASCPYRLI